MIYLFVSFAVFLVGCSTAKTSTFADNLEVKALPSSTPNTTQQKDEARFLRQEGFSIPMPEKRKQFKTYVKNSKAENGQMVKREMTTYAPANDFFFERESGTSSSGNEIKSELLKLQSIWELKANGKVYSYTITARKAKPDEHLDHQHDFLYRYFDIDGDGKFETLVIDDSEVLVPSWTTK